jgi:transcriptional regulator with XRE-family HTH domain
MGQPTKLTPEVQNDIVEALEHGMHQESAATRAGITKQTYYNWLERGRNEPGSIYADFLDAVEKARARPEAEALEAIHVAWRDGTWQAAAWFLERSHPHKYGRINRTEVSGPEGAPVKVETTTEAILQALGVNDADPPV